MDCIVGSGPAAVACAAALVERGRQVKLIDAGIRLEPERADLAARLGQSRPEHWDPAILERFRDGMDPGVSGPAEKRLFGSDYPYRDADRELGLAPEGIGLRASLGFGGLSTVWGAAMLPSIDRDISDWPITAGDLAPHYRAVLELTGSSGEADALARLFPLHREPDGRLEPSRQARVMLERLDRNRAALEQAGIFHGRARVAIRAARDSQPGCVYCGQCMYGCPYGYIYRADRDVARWQSRGALAYEGDALVTSLEESAQGVTLRGRHRVTHAPLEWRARRVYLAAGVIPTTGILLRSLAAYDRPVVIRDSQYFLQPMLQWKRVAAVRDERLYSLCQIFLDILDPAISPHTVHLQVYSFNDLIRAAVRRAMGPLAGPLDFLARELEGRLLVIQGFLHSNHSSRIEVVLRPARNGAPERLQLRADVDPGAAALVRRSVRKLLRHAGKLGAVPLLPLLQVGEPGRSFHAGGSFPMRRDPGAWDSDVLGRPAGLSRVHAVDASVFPGVPATTITLTVMANAHRIAAESAALD